MYAIRGAYGYVLRGAPRYVICLHIGMLYSVQNLLVLTPAPKIKESLKLTEIARNIVPFH